MASNGSKPDPLEVVQAGAREAREHYLSIRRAMRDDVILRPLVGERRKRSEWRERMASLAFNPAQLLGTMDEERALYKVPDEAPIPRRLAEALDRAFGELAKEAEE